MHFKSIHNVTVALIFVLLGADFVIADTEVLFEVMAERK